MWKITTIHRAEGRGGPVGSKSATAVGNVPIDAFVVFPLIVLREGVLCGCWYSATQSRWPLLCPTTTVNNCWESDRRPAQLTGWRKDRRIQMFSNHQKFTFEEEYSTDIFTPVNSREKCKGLKSYNVAFKVSRNQNNYFLSGSRHQSICFQTETIY